MKLLLKCSPCEILQDNTIIDCISQGEIISNLWIIIITHIFYEVKKDGKNYAGYTQNLKLRFEQHQKGLVRSTKDRRPLKLIYYEACLSRADALKREKYFKTHYGKMFLKKRLSKWFLQKQ